MTALPATINVVVMRDVAQAELDRIVSVAPGRIKITALWRGYREELQKHFAEPRIAMFERIPNPVPAITRGQVDEAIAEAHVMYGGAVHPPAMYDEMPNLRWVHFTFAGLSSIRRSNFWGALIDVTYSRGHSGALPIAEIALTGGLMMAKDFPAAVRQTDAGAFNPADFAALLISGKTMGIIGLGGIGMNLARLASGVGMRVIGSRHSVTTRQPGEGPVAELFPPADLHAMLGESDFVAICAPLSPDTEGLFDAAAFEAMKPGTIFMNTSRGEIVDEPSLIAALKDGRLRGAYLDVYAGDEEGRERPVELTSLPNVVMTPHSSPRSDVSHMFALDLFCENLDRFLKGEPLVNVVDWDRGY